MKLPKCKFKKRPIICCFECAELYQKGNVCNVMKDETCTDCDATTIKCYIPLKQKGTKK